MGNIRETQRFYYFAPARLSLGEYYLNGGQLAEAIANFELARAYANVASDEYEPYHSSLYLAYSSMGLWSRALEFGEPSDNALELLNGTQLFNLLMHARALRIGG